MRPNLDVVRLSAAHGAPLRSGVRTRARRERTRGARALWPSWSRQVLISPCGLNTNFFATPLSKSL
jgi:hypothetical protein